MRLNVRERPVTGSLQCNWWIPQDKTVICFLQRDLSKHHNILSVCSEYALFWHYLGKINRFFTILDLNVFILEDFIFPTSEIELNEGCKGLLPYSKSQNIHSEQSFHGLSQPRLSCTTRWPFNGTNMRFCCKIDDVAKKRFLGLIWTQTLLRESRFDSESNLESIKLAQFTPNEKCLLKPEPIT